MMPKNESVATQHLSPEKPWIIFFGEDWGRHNFSGQYIAEALAGRARVLWINGIGLRSPGLTRSDLLRIVKKAVDFLRDQFRNAQPGPGIPEHVHLHSPLILPFFQYASIRRINRFLLLRQLRSRMQRLGMSHWVVVAGLPTAGDVVGDLGASKIIYYCADDYGSLAGVNAETIRPIEDRLLADADLVLATSPALVEALRQRHSTVHYFQHGVHYQRFHAAADGSVPRPRDVPESDVPVVGYVGLIGEHIDLDLVVRAATALPEARFLMVGPVEEQIEELPSLPNLSFLGPRRHELLPSYLATFDVALIPWKHTRRNRYASPVKLREYLAAGCPVVASSVIDSTGYEEAVDITNDPEQFIKAIRRRCNRDQETDRLRISSLVASDSWESRASTLLELAGV